MSDSFPSWPFGYVPTPEEWANEWASKVDATNGTAANLTINGATASGTWTITGATFTGGTFNGATLGGAITLTGTISGGAITGATITGSIVQPSTLLVGSTLTAVSIVALDSLSEPQNLTVGTGLSIVGGNELVATASPPQTPKGNWLPASNSPSLGSGGAGGVGGDFYNIITGGTHLIDGVSIWPSGSVIENIGGTVWIQQDWPSTFGTMATQNANSVAITGGTVTDLSLLGVGTGYTVTLANPLLPIFAEVETGSDGKSVAGYFNGATRYIQNVTADVGNFASLNATAASIATLDINGLIIKIGNVLSGVQVGFSDITGTKDWLTYDYNDTVSVNALRVGGTLVGGAGASSSGVPTWAVDSTKFGAELYMRRGHFYATYTSGGVTISAAKFVGAVTATVGSAAFGIVGAIGTGVAFQPGYDDGQPIFIQGAGVGGADKQTTIKQCLDGENVILSDTLDTAPTGSGVNVVWPCWTGDDLNTLLWIDCGELPVYTTNFTSAATTTQVGAVTGGNTIVVASAAGIIHNQTVIDNTNTAAIPGSAFPGLGQGTQVTDVSGTTLTLSDTVTSSNGDSLSFGQVGVHNSDTTSPTGVQPLIAHITSIISPTEIGITFDGKAGITGMPYTASGIVTEMAWGVDDSTAISAAADFAPTIGSKFVYVPGPDKGCMTASIWSAGGFQRQWIANNPDQAIDYFVNLIGDNRAGGHHVDSGGRKLWLKQVPAFAGGIPQNMRTANLHKQCPGLAGKTSLRVCIMGASLGQTDPQGQDPLWFDSDMMVEKLISDNAGVALTFVNYSVGGTSLAEFDNGLVGNASAYYWYTNPAQSIFDYTLLQSPTPDLIIIPAAGANDGWGFHPNHWHSVVNRLRAKFPSAYILWQIIGNKGQQGYQLPGLQPTIDSYPNGYVRGACTQLNIPFVDPDPLAGRVHWGWDPLRMRERYFPSYTGPISPSAPWNVAMLLRDYSGIWTLGSGITGAAAWTAIGKLRFPLSDRPDNFFDLDITSGNLRYAVQDWGSTVTTPCTMATGSHTLVTSGQTTFSGNIRWRVDRRDIEVGSPSGPFTSGDIGKCFLFPNADANGLPMRSFILRVAASYSAFSPDRNTVNVNVSASPGSVTYGGMMFKPEDATAGADCIIGPDGSGNVLVTKVATYTSATQITTVDPWPYPPLSSGAPVPVFIGYRSVPPTATTIAAGTDTGVGARVQVSAKGRRLICRYWVGGATYNTPPIVADLIVPRLGGEFPLSVLCTGAGTTLAGANLWRDEEDYSWRAETFYELSGAIDDNHDGRNGGGGPHPSSVSAELTTRPALEANDLAF